MPEVSQISSESLQQVVPRGLPKYAMLEFGLDPIICRLLVCLTFWFVDMCLC